MAPDGGEALCCGLGMGVIGAEVAFHDGKGAGKAGFGGGKLALITLDIELTKYALLHGSRGNCFHVRVAMYKERVTTCCGSSDERVN